MLISWPAFTAPDGKPLAAGTMSLAIGAGGSVSLALVPNEGATPNGTYYKVVLKLEDGTTETEYWSIPKRTPVKVSEVRSQVVPASVAIQMASRTYVDSTLAGKADDGKVIHVTGDEVVSGVKQFAASPLVPIPTLAGAIANKSYVDSAVASIGAGDFLRKGGDVMLGSFDTGRRPHQHEPCGEPSLCRPPGRGTHEFDGTKAGSRKRYANHAWRHPVRVAISVDPGSHRRCGNVRHRPDSARLRRLGQLHESQAHRRSGSSR
jgi:hypothetical protein